jgi:hypothetical protein
MQRIYPFKRVTVSCRTTGDFLVARCETLSSGDERPSHRPMRDLLIARCETLSSLDENISHKSTKIFSFFLFYCTDVIKDFSHISNIDDGFNRRSVVMTADAVMSCVKTQCIASLQEQTPHHRQSQRRMPPPLCGRARGEVMI